MRRSSRTRRGGAADLARAGGVALRLALPGPLRLRRRLSRRRDARVAGNPLDGEASDRRAPDASGDRPGRLRRRADRAVRGRQRRRAPRLALRDHRGLPAHRGGSSRRSLRGPPDVPAEVLRGAFHRRSDDARDERPQRGALAAGLRRDQPGLHDLRRRRGARRDAGGRPVADPVGAGAVSGLADTGAAIQPQSQRANGGRPGSAQRAVCASPGVPERHVSGPRVHARASRARGLRPGQP